MKGADIVPEVIEVSPCERWHKLEKAALQGHIPLTAKVYLTMDQEEGTEVVWSELSDNLIDMGSISSSAKGLIDIEHPNILKLRDVWTDNLNNNPRAVFITEFMPFGSVKQRLRILRNNKKPLKTWGKWCLQVLSALTYLHSREPPIVHGHISTDTMFPDQDGSIKMSSTIPQVIMHAASKPKYNPHSTTSWASDIYYLGLFALEMATLGVVQHNGLTKTSHTSILESLTALDDDLQRDFIQKCLILDPAEIPSAAVLLSHPALIDRPTARLAMPPRPFPGTITIDSADEIHVDDVLDISPCERWQKHRLAVTQGDVLGADRVHLATDMQEGKEVVWSQVQVHRSKLQGMHLISQEANFLKDLEHPNILKLHQYWTAGESDSVNAVFITECMTFGSLDQFIRIMKANNKPVKTWKSWCVQMLSALTYLHSFERPVIHGNISTGTVYMHDDGSIKITPITRGMTSHILGKVANPPIAPDYELPAAQLTCAVDVYLLGLCALEIAASGIPDHAFAWDKTSRLSTLRLVALLEDPLQRDFILQCLAKYPADRPSSATLLTHPALRD